MPDRSASGCASVSLDVRLADHGNPLGVLALEIARELCRYHRYGLGAERVELLDDGGIFQDLRKRIVESGHDLGRRARGREQSGEGLTVKFRIAELGEGR